MKKTIFTSALLALICMFQVSAGAKKAPVAPPGELTLSNDRISVTVTASGHLKSLKNNVTGQEYATGGYLWRLYYDAPERKENQITGEDQKGELLKDGDAIILKYSSLKSYGEDMDMTLELRISLEADKVRFASKMANNVAHTVIRELQYPLVRGINLPEDHKLITSYAGGQIHENPVDLIYRKGFADGPYKRPDQFFRTLSIKYPSGAGMNCFVFASEDQGLYFGSHDDTFQDTWHGLRLYSDENKEFTILEGGFYKYPHCFAGETWECSANVVAPYSGTWHTASRIYREWADTWFDHRDPPAWVKTMPSWQRVIFKHQYGEYFYKYTDLYGKMKDAGHSVGCNAVLAFGWWEEGMDHGNPDYSPDRSQGGDEGWAAAIREFKKDGDKLMMYYNGKLIDRESSFYKSGEGKKVCYHDNTGAERTEQYRFTALGTWLGEYDARTFVVANTTHDIWRQKLLDMATRAFNCGANSVFYDQLGYGESKNTDWDLSREYPVPNMRTLYDKGQTLKLIREHNLKLDPEFAMGTEWLTDYCAQYVDYIHMYPENSGKEDFREFFRFTFPEIIFSDRGLRDDTDVERRVNLNILKGIRNDIEIYRCRDLITDTPHYQAYLAKVNAIKNKYPEILLAGKYCDVMGFNLTDKRVNARSFVAGDKMAVVMTNDLASKEALHTAIEVPGYVYAGSEVVGGAKVFPDGSSVVLGQHDLAVLIFEKK